MTHPDLYKKLLKTFSQVHTDDSQMNMFLHAILTPSEINDVSLRLEILRRLYRGDTQRDIAESLGVGLATVTRGSRQLKESGGIFDDLLK